MGQTGRGKSTGQTGGEGNLRDKQGEREIYGTNRGRGKSMGQTGRGKSTGQTGGEGNLRDKRGEGNLWDKRGEGIYGTNRRRGKSTGQTGGEGNLRDKQGEREIYGTNGEREIYGTNRGRGNLRDKQGEREIYGTNEERESTGQTGGEGNLQDKLGEREIYRTNGEREIYGTNRGRGNLQTALEPRFPLPRKRSSSLTYRLPGLDRQLRLGTNFCVTLLVRITLATACTYSRYTPVTEVMKGGLFKWVSPWLKPDGGNAILQDYRVQRDKRYSEKAKRKKCIFEKKKVLLITLEDCR
ncbi:uncharacterized protein LOC102353840 [Latimeria chalumnae]|uniref:uncharacterized protein LOC102353840 n=1 Tax=Latimeria chalumnae TaxID=7897 RepID=UPI00313E2E9D